MIVPIFSCDWQTGTLLEKSQFNERKIISPYAELSVNKNTEFHLN